MGKREGRCLLLVDDEEANHALIAPFFEGEGFRVFSAFDGEEALEVLGRERIDLVLLDLRMSGMGGLDVLLEIRKTHNRVELPVFILTGVDNSDEMVSALKMGANDYLLKPMDFTVALARIEGQFQLAELDTPRRSGFHRLRKTPVPPTPNLTHHCAACLTALAESEGCCPECSAKRPPEGWVKTAGSPLRWLGQVLGRRFQAERSIGHGAASVVYRVRDLDLGTRYAAKIIALAEGEGKRPVEVQRERLKTEIEALAQLTNPHVVHIHDVIDLNEGLFALITGYVQGTSLQEVLDAQGRLDPPTALEVLRQLSQGLHEAHTLGLVHRDIKPANVMMERLPAGGYFVRLLDFGIAWRAGGDESLETTPGTPRYMAPEQITNKAIDARTDIYGLGCMLFHMLTGRPPYRGRNLRQLLLQHIEAPPPRIGDIDLALSVIPELESMTLRMMAKDPDDRPADLAEVIEAVNKISLTLSFSAKAAPSTPAIAQPTPPRPSTGTPTADSTSGEIVRAAISRRNTAVALALTPSGRRSIWEFDFTTAAARRRALDTHSTHDLIAIDAEGRWAALCGVSDPDIWRLDLELRSEPTLLEYAGDRVTALTIAPVGGAIAYGLESGEVYVADAQHPPGRLISQGASAVTALSFLPHGLSIAIGRADQTLQISPLAQNQPTHVAQIGVTPVEICLTRERPMEGAMLTDQGILILLEPGQPARAIRLDPRPLAIQLDQEGALLGLFRSPMDRLKLADLAPLTAKHAKK